MEVIKRLSDTKGGGGRFAMSAAEKALLNKPAGLAPMGVGPADQVCGACLYFDAGNSVLSDLGVAAHCLLARRLHQRGKKPPIIPASWRCCIEFKQRPGVVAIMHAANFDARIVALRRQAERIQAELQRVNSQIGEIEHQRSEMTDVADKAGNDPDAMARLGAEWNALERERRMDIGPYLGAKYYKHADLPPEGIEVTIIDVGIGRYGAEMTFDTGCKLGINTGNGWRLVEFYGRETLDFIGKLVHLSPGQVPNGNGVMVDSVIVMPRSPKLLPAERTPIALPPPEDEEDKKSGPGPNPLDDDIPFDF